MHGPTVVSWLVAALAVGAAGLCLLRLRGAGCAGPERRHPDRESDTAEAVMALGMAGMVALPGPLWGWLFAALAGALLLALVGLLGPGPRAHRLHHGVGALAMAYMALAMPGGSGGPHGSGGHYAAAAVPGLPLVTGALLLYFGAYSLWAGSRLLSTPAGPLPAAGGDGLGRACRVAMGIGMFAMLLTM
ncbi:DUF5134 domain-containing protein [Kitasatospora sp. MBT63]|uniref:DUF5134 domain-containing protein n=1 Tax=Kitasatospora sp. MBT63 TaxID=1444768 RepID=UPI00053975D7|nr:DUF5134 domain-containing protein [Kitasatospora sp. MBT63]